MQLDLIFRTRGNIRVSWLFFLEMKLNEPLNHNAFCALLYYMLAYKLNKLNERKNSGKLIQIIYLAFLR